jgi:hypothetical protein
MLLMFWLTAIVPQGIEEKKALDSFSEIGFRTFLHPRFERPVAKLANVPEA